MSQPGVKRDQQLCFCREEGTLSSLVLKWFCLKYVLYGEKMYTVFCDVTLYQYDYFSHLVKFFLSFFPWVWSSKPHHTGAVWSMGHATPGKEWDARAFGQCDNPLWEATTSGGNRKASLSQVVFFHSQLVSSFPWPIPLVPSLLWSLRVLSLRWLPVAFAESGRGFLFS